MVHPTSTILLEHKGITAMHLPRIHYPNSPQRIQIDVHRIQMIHSDSTLRQQQIMLTYQIIEELLAR